MDHGGTHARASGIAKVGPAFPALPDFLRFPAEDDGQSLADAARRDLGSALQLLAERAQYIMGASGVAIALRDGEEMVCRASAGPSAPVLESRFQVDAGLTAESIRQRQVLRCDDAESDGRVDRESCRALGVKSVMVSPLLRRRQAIGVFELLAERSYAFEEHDVTALERLSEMVLTALEHADGVAQAAIEVAADEVEAQVVEEDFINEDFIDEIGVDEDPVDEVFVDQNREAPITIEELVPEISEPIFLSDLTQENLLQEDRAQEDLTRENLAQEIGQIHKCAACSFPVSANRSLCLDCEKAAKSNADDPDQLSNEGSELLATYGESPAHGWLASCVFVVAIMMTALAILWLVFRLH
jgi:putative methionine-R-sulfoxide reductase with GAF domain